MALRTHMSRRTRAQARAIPAPDAKRGPMQMMLGLLMLAGLTASILLGLPSSGTNLLLINP
jgi:hypothetical protein